MHKLDRKQMVPGPVGLQARFPEVAALGERKLILLTVAILVFMGSLAVLSVVGGVLGLSWTLWMNVAYLSLASGVTLSSLGFFDWPQVAGEPWKDWSRCQWLGALLSLVALAALLMEATA